MLLGKRNCHKHFLLAVFTIFLLLGSVCAAQEAEWDATNTDFPLFGFGMPASIMPMYPAMYPGMLDLYSPHNSSQHTDIWPGNNLFNENLFYPININIWPALTGIQMFPTYNISPLALPPFYGSSLGLGIDTTNTSSYFQSTLGNWGFLHIPRNHKIRSDGLTISQ